MAEDETTPPAGLSTEEKDNIQKDIQEARGNIVSKETDSLLKEARNEAKQEAEKEFVTNAKIKELTEINEKLKSEQVEKEKAAAEKFDTLNAKVNEMITSKAPAQNVDPFKKTEQTKNKVDNMSPQQVNDIETASARVFFGENYDQMMRQ